MQGVRLVLDTSNGGFDSHIPDAERKNMCPKCNERPKLDHHSYCRSCKQEYDREYWHKNKKKHRKARKERIRKNKVWVYKYFESHPCTDCGESDPVVLEFDHQGDKEHGISTMVGEAYALSTIKKEIAKCEVVCANCHRRRTAKQLNWYKYI